MCVWGWGGGGGKEIVEEGETYIQQQLHSERGENEERGRLVEETTAYRYIHVVDRYNVYRCSAGV